MYGGRNGEDGFTLIELLVVIGIIAVLASIVIASLSPARAKARDAHRRSDLKQLQLALEFYYDDHNSYPVTNGLLSEARCTPTCASCGWTATIDYAGANAYIPNLAPMYISVLPGDPALNPSSDRCYVYSGWGTGYILWAHHGAEAAVDPNDPLLRLLPPSCTQVQDTFQVTTNSTRCN